MFSKILAMSQSYTACTHISSYSYIATIYRKRGKIRWAKLSHFSWFSRVLQKISHEYKHLSFTMLNNKLAKATQKCFCGNFNGVETLNIQPRESFPVYSNRAVAMYSIKPIFYHLTNSYCGCYIYKMRLQYKVMLCYIKYYTS